MPDSAKRMRHRPAAWLTAVEVAVVLPIVKLLLWRRGYQRTMQLLSAIPHRAVSTSSSTAATTPDQVAVVAAAVAMVSRLHPVSSLCLARSVTIWLLSRRRGHPVDVVMGVALEGPQDVRGHAWAEYAGLPLNDAADVRSRYQTMEFPEAR